MSHVEQQVKEQPTREHIHTGKTYHVQCRGFRCIAYRDRHNQWRTYYGNRLIQGDVEVLGEF